MDSMGSEKIIKSKHTDGGSSGSGRPVPEHSISRVSLEDLDTHRVTKIVQSMSAAAIGDIQAKTGDQKWDGRRYVAGVFTYNISGSPSALETFKTLLTETDNFASTLSDMPSWDLEDRISERIEKATQEIKEGNFVPTPKQQKPD